MEKQTCHCCVSDRCTNGIKVPNEHCTDEEVERSEEVVMERLSKRESLPVEGSAWLTAHRCVCETRVAVAAA